MEVKIASMGFFLLPRKYVYFHGPWDRDDCGTFSGCCGGLIVVADSMDDYTTSMEVNQTFIGILPWKLIKASIDIAGRFHGIYFLLPWNPPSLEVVYFMQILLPRKQKQTTNSVEDRHGGLTPARIILRWPL